MVESLTIKPDRDDVEPRDCLLALGGDSCAHSRMMVIAAFSNRDKENRGKIAGFRQDVITALSEETEKPKDSLAQKSKMGL